ncbi:HAD family hydrolase [Glaesserella sp.]|uniref:HAD family hydrolase n=1 Tax=Glaesserella sp. TaxID=2094731 RepID=UPI0035A1BEA9
MLKLIVFDMDGVIVDSEYQGFSFLKQFIESLKTHDDDITHEQYSAIIGCSYDDLYQAIKSLSQSELTLTQIGEKLLQEYNSSVGEYNYLTIFRKDIIDIIQFAKQQGIKLAVASSSEQTHIEKVLGLCDIHQHFDLILSGRKFPKSKPDPAIYQAVLTYFGIKGYEAVAIEDSSHGIRAAKAAGLTVIAYEETRMAIDQSQADYKGKTMLEILNIIQQLAD